MSTSPTYALLPIQRRIMDLFDGRPADWRITWPHIMGFGSPATVRMVIGELVAMGLLVEARAPRRHGRGTRLGWTRA